MDQSHSIWFMLAFNSRFKFVFTIPSGKQNTTCVNNLGALSTTYPFSWTDPFWRFCMRLVLSHHVYRDKQTILSMLSVNPHLALPCERCEDPIIMFLYCKRQLYKHTSASVFKGKQTKSCLWLWFFAFNVGDEFYFL